jgi:hypothetical protein
MIVRTLENEWLCVAQPDHAGLSGALVDAWQADGLHDRDTRDSIRLAAREHDNGWREVDRAPLLDPARGVPYDFVRMPDEIKHEIWPRAVARLAAVDSYAAALVAEHALNVHGQHHGRADWKPFFSEMTGLRDDQLRHSGRTGVELDRDYAAVELADLLSLIYCNGWLGPRDMHEYRAELRGDNLEITPDPFGGTRVPLRVEARVLQPGPYPSQQALERAYASAERRWLTGLAVGLRERPA